MGGKDVMPVISGIQAFDEHGNSYHTKAYASSDEVIPSDASSIDPDHEKQFHFLIADRMIASAKFLILKIKKGIFANAASVTFRIRLFEKNS